MTDIHSKIHISEGKRNLMCYGRNTGELPVYVHCDPLVSPSSHGTDAPSGVVDLPTSLQGVGPSPHPLLPITLGLVVLRVVSYASSTSPSHRRPVKPCSKRCCEQCWGPPDITARRWSLASRSDILKKDRFLNSSEFI